MNMNTILGKLDFYKYICYNNIMSIQNSITERFVKND